MTYSTVQRSTTATVATRFGPILGSCAANQRERATRRMGATIDD
jgi:hypothetical protein